MGVGGLIARIGTLEHGGKGMKARYRTVLGTALLSLPGVGIVVFMGLAYGWETAAILVGVVAAVSGCVIGGVALISADDEQKA